MVCSVRTVGLTGIRGNSVAAECFISNGLPGFDIVGLPDAAVKEARERVRAAAKSSGLRFPVSRITVNLAPAFWEKSVWTESCGACPGCCPWPLPPGRTG